MKTKRKKTSRMMRKLSGCEKELLIKDRIISARMANCLYNLAQQPSLAAQSVDSIRGLYKERDAHRELIRPLMERLTK